MARSLGDALRGAATIVPEVPLCAAAGRGSAPVGHNTTLPTAA